jgi:hypothetical protein
MLQCRVALNWFPCNGGPRVQERKYCGYHLQKSGVLAIAAGPEPAYSSYSSVTVDFQPRKIVSTKGRQSRRSMKESSTFSRPCTNQVAFDSFVISDGFLHTFQASYKPSFPGNHHLLPGYLATSPADWSKNYSIENSRYTTLVIIVIICFFCGK